MEFSEILCFLLALVTTASSLSTTLTLHEQQRITIQLQKNEYDDLKSVYYAVTSLNAIGKDPSHKESYCRVATTKFDKKSVVEVFQFSQIVKILKCKNVPDVSIADLITEEMDSVTFARAIISMVNLGQAVPKNVVDNFVSVAKDNDSPASGAVIFHAASVLPKTNSLLPIVSMVEDILAQADEINNEFLQFEGGLAVTSQIVRGILALGDQQGKALIKKDQLLKFTAYFLNRKFVYSLKDIHHLTSALSAIAKNKHQVPVVVSSFKTNAITKENPLMKVRVTNVLDESIDHTTVTALAFMTSDEVTTLFDNKQFTKSPEKDDYVIVEGEVARGYVPARSSFIDIMVVNPSRGLFKCNIGINIARDASKYTIVGEFLLNVKVLSKVVAEDLVIVVGDRDQVAQKQKSQLKYPDKLTQPIEADYHQKIVMTFNLKDLNSGELVTAHQAFIRLVHETSGQEIFFVGESDDADRYSFTLDVGAAGKDSFNNLSGKYKMSLIVGDAAMQVPISWALGDAVLKFSGEAKTTKRQERVVQPKPVIEHMFRQPEKRPPKVVSSAFTILVLSPFLVMFGMWLKIGVNLSNFKFSLSTIVFHLGLAAIFGLYYMFWVQLDMFQTMKLLMLIGGLTFLAGNRMLADMAASKYAT